jgi:hypothetical protein
LARGRNTNTGRKEKRGSEQRTQKSQILVRDVFSHPFDTRGSVSVLRVQGSFSEKNNNARAAGGVESSFLFSLFGTFSKR